MSTDSTLIAPPERTSSSRLILTLGLAGFFSGIILVSTYILTLPEIEANKAAALEQAIYQVLKGAVSYETLSLQNDHLAVVEEEASGTGDEKGPFVYAGYDAAGTLLGFAIPAEEPGFQDVIAGIFGYDPAKPAIIGFVVLESKETPGLGDKIIKDASFIANFQALAVDPGIRAVKRGEKKNPNEVEAITGATISSKAVVRLLQNGLGEWREPIDAYWTTKHAEITQ